MISVYLNSLLWHPVQKNVLLYPFFFVVVFFWSLGSSSIVVIISLCVKCLLYFIHECITLARLHVKAALLKDGKSVRHGDADQN